MLAPVLRLEPTLRDEMRACAAALDAAFDALLPLPEDGRRPLVAAMRYAAMGGGKRLRPLLALGAARLLGVPEDQALRAGLAVECIHVQSLIHDDLPCMDDDDLRRGRPTVHRAFDEATALLAGDALHALAFEVLASPATHPDGERRAELVASLARAAGAGGMAGGQMLDLAAEREGALGEAQIARMQRLKTGALMAWPVEAACLLAGSADSTRLRLGAYAECLGLAFQIADNLIDAQGDERAAGKRVGKDAAQGKQGFVSMLGAGGARSRAEALRDQALGHIAGFGPDARLLRDLASFVVHRDR